MRILYFFFICLLSFLLSISAQNPANWKVSEPALSPDPAVDQKLEKLIRIIGKKNYTHTLQIASDQVETIYKKIGIARTPFGSEALSLKLRTLWHDLSRIYYCIGIDKDVYASRFKILLKSAEEIMIVDPRLSMLQIARRIQDISRVVGISMPDIPEVK